MAAPPQVSVKSKFYRRLSFEKYDRVQQSVNTHTYIHPSTESDRETYRDSRDTQRERQRQRRQSIET